MSGKPDKSNGQPPPERTWTEAPASTTIRFALEGYDCMLTLRGESGADVLPKVQMAIEWLKKTNAEPTTRGNGNGRAGGAPSGSTGTQV